jgi:hypothetical protein
MGDCNAPATYQALMNHIFSPYIGRFLDVYLDDIIIYSDSFEEHIKHVKIAIDVLRREQLYLSLKKLHFLEDELRLLGRIVGKDGIRMDPTKVDQLLPGRHLQTGTYFMDFLVLWDILQMILQWFEFQWLYYMD